MAESTQIDLGRFERHHPHDFERALAEVRAGQKRSHWMWFIFPQLTALGRSSTAKEYGINSIEEAQAYAQHPVLGRDYALIVDAVNAQLSAGANLTRLMGTPDDLKLVSSVTLFGGIGSRLADGRFGLLADVCDEVLASAVTQGFAPCAVTRALLAAS